MNQGFVCGVNQATPITLEVSKNVWSTPLRRGRRLSIIEFLQPLISFVYGLVIGGVNRKSYIQIMEQEAQDAKKTGRTRVIVQSFRADTSMP